MLNNLILQIKNRVLHDHIKSEARASYLEILADAQEMNNYGEWLIAYENMIANLAEYDFGPSDLEKRMIQKIFLSRDPEWRDKWSWILEWLEEEK